MRLEQIEQGTCHYFGGLVQVFELELFIRSMTVRFEAAWTCAVEHGRDARGTVVACVGVERHPMRLDLFTQHSRAHSRGSRRPALLVRERHERLGQQNAAERLRLSPAICPPTFAAPVSGVASTSAGFSSGMMRRSSAEDLTLIRHDVGIDAAFDQPDHQRRRLSMPGSGANRGIRLAQRVQIGEQAVGRFQRVDSLVRLRRVPRFAAHVHFEMNAAVVRGRDGVGEAGAIARSPVCLRPAQSATPGRSSHLLLRHK